MAPPCARPGSSHARVTSGGRSLAGDDALAREQHRPLDDVRQLAHVARELVAREHLEHLGRDARGGAAEALGVARDEVLDEQRDVPAPLAQRRHAHRHDLQAEEQVLAEAARGDLVLEIAVGRGDDAHVDLDGLGRADAPDLALLQHAQELHLHLGADLADLVEEQRAAVRLLEEAALRARWRP